MSEPIEITIRRGDYVFRLPSTDATVDINVRSASLADFCFGKPYPAPSESESLRSASFLIRGTSSSMLVMIGKRDPWWLRLKTRIKAALNARPNQLRGAA